MDTYTLQELLNEAKKNFKKAEKEFNKYDNIDDMHEMAAWQHVKDWLKEKIKFHKKPQ